MPQTFMITQTMRVADVLSVLPESERLLAEYGLHCVGCHYNAYETLEEGSENHGFSSEDLNDLIADLNLLLSEQPERPKTIGLTAEAAKQLKQILEADGKADWGLLVGLDEHGAFCLEAQEKAKKDETTFLEPHHDGLKIFASELTLRGIGGSTIDFRDGRFKLDLPEDRAAGCGCKNGGECGCK